MLFSEVASDRIVRPAERDEAIIGYGHAECSECMHAWCLVGCGGRLESSDRTNIRQYANYGDTVQTGEVPLTPSRV